MKLLVFEYSCVCLEDSLMSEGFNMLKSLLDDLDYCSLFDVYCIINKSVSDLNYDNCNIIYLEYNLIDWLNENSYCFDYCIFIAPEDDLIQYRITKVLEKNDVSLIGCNSTSSYICSSKDLTYKKVSDKILKIKSIKSNVDELDYNIICNILNKNHFIIKPDKGTSSKLVFHIKNKTELENALKDYEKKHVNEIIIQEYVLGDILSVSLICNKNNIECISVNTQEIAINNNKIKYLGCESPIKHHLEERLYYISKKIIKSITQLKGFVGIDYIIQKDKIYFVEINARLTTPYIVLQKTCEQNLTESLIKFVLYDIPLNLTFKNQSKFKISDKNENYRNGYWWCKY